LLFRLNVLSVRLPALRARAGDVALLTEAFLSRLSAEYAQPAKSISQRSLVMLESYSWPGNVRELENLVYREWLLAAESEINITAIEQDDAVPLAVLSDSDQQTFRAAKAHVVAEFERAYMSRLMARTSGNMTLAAQIAGKDRSDLGKLLKKHGLARQVFLG
jgi:DNA-binding NtrC family response regulator